MRPSEAPVATSQSLTPVPPAVASIAPSALMLTPKVPFTSTWNGPCRTVRDFRSQTVARPLWLTAPSVCPSALNARSVTSPPVPQRTGPTGVSLLASQSRIPSKLRPTAIIRPSGLNLPGCRSGHCPGASVVREGEAVVRTTAPR